MQHVSKIYMYFRFIYTTICVQFVSACTQLLLQQIQVMLFQTESKEDLKGKSQIFTYPGTFRKYKFIQFMCMKQSCESF